MIDNEMKTRPSSRQTDIRIYTDFQCRCNELRSANGQDGLHEPESRAILSYIGIVGQSRLMTDDAVMGMDIQQLFKRPHDFMRPVKRCETGSSRVS